MESERTNAEYLSEAKTILEGLINCSDELPDEFIQNDSVYFRHKFRGNWFQGVISNVQLVADICNDTQLMQDAIAFANRRRAKDKKTRTTKEEIDEADQLIRRHPS